MTLSGPPRRSGMRAARGRSAGGKGSSGRRRSPVPPSMPRRRRPDAGIPGADGTCRCRARPRWRRSARGPPRPDGTARRSIPSSDSRPTNLVVNLRSGRDGPDQPVTGSAAVESRPPPRSAERGTGAVAALTTMAPGSARSPSASRTASGAAWRPYRRRVPRSGVPPGPAPCGSRGDARPPRAPRRASGPPPSGSPARRRPRAGRRLRSAPDRMPRPGSSRASSSTWPPKLRILSTISSMTRLVSDDAGSAPRGTSRARTKVTRRGSQRRSVAAAAPR